MSYPRMVSYWFHTDGCSTTALYPLVPCCHFLLPSLLIPSILFPSFQSDCSPTPVSHPPCWVSLYLTVWFPHSLSVHLFCSVKGDMSVILTDKTYHCKNIFPLCVVVVRLPETLNQNHSCTRLNGTDVAVFLTAKLANLATAGNLWLVNC